ncbi:MAG: substrate-binding domain-containing protein [Acidimicrobiia bacterium]
MKISKTVAAVVGVGLVAAGLLTAGPASADPNGTPAGNTRPLQGVGSDTTQNVMSDLADAITIGGVKVIASWDATGTGSFTTRSGNAACTYPRAEANGSGNGRSRLLESLTSGNARSGCLDFSRSSSARGTFTSGGPASATSMTWVPFASDASTVVVRADGGLPRSYTLADLQSIYRCELVPDIYPVLPQTGSGSRSFWLTTMNITEAQISAGTYPCLTGAGTTASRAYVQENDSRTLKTDEVFPFSIGLYNTQAAGVNPDFRGKAVLAQVGGALPQETTEGFPINRALYNIIPTSKIGTAPWSTVFVGSSSLVCTSTATTIKNGFKPLTATSTPVCGDTSSQS